MSLKSRYENSVQVQLDEFKAEARKLREKAGQTEANLELEVLTLIDELHVTLEAAEQKFELLKQAQDHNWEHFKTELEQSWTSLRQLIGAITSP